MVLVLQTGDSLVHCRIGYGSDFNMKKKKKYKLTKEDWMMILDFWPLSIFTPAMLILILLGPIIMK